MPASRTSFDGHSIHENTTVSSGLGLDCHVQVGLLAVGHLVAPALDHAHGTDLPEHIRGHRGVLGEGLPIAGWHRGHEPVDIAHRQLPSGSLAGAQPPPHRHDE